MRRGRLGEGSNQESVFLILKKCKRQWGEDLYQLIKHKVRMPAFGEAKECDLNRFMRQIL